MIISTDISVPKELVAQLPRLPASHSAIGLLRTEYLFAGWSRWPTVTEQAQAYASVFCRTGCDSARVRVFDVAASKTPWAPDQHTAHEGVSYLLRHEELLRKQLDAFLVAAEKHDVCLQAAAPYVIEPQHAEQFARIASEAGLREPAVMLETPLAITLAEQYCVGFSTAVIGLGDLTALLLGMERGISAAPAPADLLLVAIKRLLSANRLSPDSGPAIAICAAADPELASLLAHRFNGVELIIPYAEVTGL